MIKEGDESIQVPGANSWVDEWNRLAPTWRRPWHELIRVKTELIRPPFSQELVERARRYYMDQQQPWLPLARPREEYQRLWMARETPFDGYELDESPAEGDPWEGASAWISAQMSGVEALFRGEPANSLDCDVLSFIESSVEEGEIPEGIAEDTWEALSTEVKIRILGERPNGPPWDYFVEMISEMAPANLVPCSQPLEELGNRGMDLPIGHVGVVDGSMPGHDARYLVVRPRVALTFLQVWLDAENRGIRLVIE